MLYINFDLSEILRLVDVKDKVERMAKDALKDLAFAVHGHIVENVQAKLHSTREKYLDGLTISPIGEDAWLISLNDKSRWLDDGMEAFDMKLGLLKSPKAKTSKNGSRYMSIPFEQNKKPSASTPAQKSLTDTVKEEFKRRKIPYGKIETDAAGTPKKGLLHSFDIKHGPIKTADVPGQGKGPIGQPFQGKTGTPFLQGIRVYQKDVKDKAGKTKTVKSVMTFRTVSSKQGSDMWMHPGLEKRGFFEEAQTWGEKEFSEKILPKLMESLGKGL